MQKDKGTSVKAYLDWSVLKVFQMEIMCSGHEFSIVQAGMRL